jgi:hypothetical protein
MAALGDFLAGVGGAPVNRPGLEAFVANSQSSNMLRSAQTEEALLNAQNLRDEQDAKGRMEQNLGDALTAVGDPHPKEHAALVNTAMAAKYGSFKDSETGYNELLKNVNTQTIMNPGADPNARLAADQAVNPGANPFQADQGQLIPRMQTTGQSGPPTVFQTPGSEATQHAQNAIGNLNQTKSDAGGFDPHKGSTASLTPEEQDAITRAVNDHRLDPTRINSRNQGVLAHIEMANPGLTDFNKLHADAALQSNPTFQQKAMSVEALPTMMSYMTTIGKKIGYSDWRTAGKVQQWLAGETNDPDVAEYGAVRNDVLLKLASTMRGVGMSDQAHTAETEAAAPTMSPLALDGWLKGQMVAVNSALEQQRKITGSHSKPTGTGTSAAAPAVPATGPSTAPTTTGALPSLSDIEAELARRQGGR